MTATRIYLCDDEALAVERLSYMLQSLPDIEIVGTATKGEFALADILRLSPDLLLLDIEMPGLDGFDIVERLSQTETPGDHAPLVVFVTAHPRFAPQAFEKGAIDFLGKPVRRSRLEAMLARSRRALADKEAGSRLDELLRELDTLRATVSRYTDEREHVWIHRQGEMVRLNIDEVTHVRAEAEYVRFFTRTASYLHRGSIGALERRLDPRLFIRIHRSTIVRRVDVIAIRRSVHGGSAVRLSGGEEASVGRKYSKAVRAAFGTDSDQ